MYVSWWTLLYFCNYCYYCTSVLTFSVVHTRRVEATIAVGRICKCVTYSDVNKSICRRQPDWYRFNAGAECFFERVSTNSCRGSVRTCNRVGWKTKGVSMSTECEEFLTPRDVYSSILQPHRGFINSEPFTSAGDSYERTVQRIYEHSYQPNYESNVSSDKTIGTISSTTDQFIISSENSRRAKRSLKTYRMVTAVMENQRNEEVGQSLLGLAKAPAVIENNRAYRGRKFWSYVTRIKQLRGM